jgi:hypothetical protein
MPKFIRAFRDNDECQFFYLCDIQIYQFDQCWQMIDRLLLKRLMQVTIANFFMAKQVVNC